MGICQSCNLFTLWICPNNDSAVYSLSVLFQSNLNLFDFCFSDYRAAVSLCWSSCKPRYKQAHGLALRMETINLSIPLQGIFITQNLTLQMKSLYSMVKLCGVLSSGEHHISWCVHAVHSDEHHVFSVWIWAVRHRWQYKMWGLPESALTSGTLPPCFCILSYGALVLSSLNK